MMKKYVLDSNIFSEINKEVVDENVRKAFFLHRSQVYLATSVWSELSYGMEILPNGRRKEKIREFLHDVVAYFPVLNYDKNSATIHAQIRANARKKGRILPFVDSQIAAIAIANEAVLVTRNVKDFRDIEGLTVVNWFEELG